MDPIVLVASAAAAGAALLVVLGLAAGRTAPATDRLHGYVGPHQEAPPSAASATEQHSLRTAAANSAVLGALNRAVERRSWSEAMARGLARADLALTPGEYIALRLAAIVGTVGGCFVLGMLFPALTTPPALLAAAGLGLLWPRIYLARRQARRLRAFNDALADTITLLANALRSGASFLQAIEMVVRESQPPVSTEFSRVVREVSLGRPLEQALQNLVRRAASDDLELMTTAISIQYQVGGNLAEILDSIAFTIRERVRIKGEIRTLTAQQRLSGYVVAFLPVALVIVLMVVAPRFMSAMFEAPPELFGVPLGVILLMMGAISMAIGFLFIRRIVDIKV